MIMAARAVVAYKSCFAAMQAFFCSCLPRYCAVTTAPPVARAEKICINKMLMESTREMPDTAASPTFVTITVSAMPMVTASSCSMTSGTSSRTSARLEKNNGFSNTRGVRLRNCICRIQCPSFLKIKNEGNATAPPPAEIGVLLLEEGSLPLS